MLYADNLEEFGRLVSGSDDNFSLNTPLCNSVIWCTQVRVGNAKFIYAAGAADDSSMVPDYKAVMVAVVADNRIYLTQSIYNLTNEPPIIPKQFCFLLQKQAELNQAGVKILMQRCDNLEPAEQASFSRADKLKIKKTVRTRILSGDRKIKLLDPCLFSTTAVLAVLAGKTDIDHVVTDYFEKKRDELAKEKLVETLISDELANPKLIKPWEYKILDALNHFDQSVYLVVVEFSHRGEICVCELSPTTIRHMLVQKKSFELNRFCAIDKPGVHLKCEDITKILFQGNVYYARS